MKTLAEKVENFREKILIDREEDRTYTAGHKEEDSQVAECTNIKCASKATNGYM